MNDAERDALVERMAEVIWTTYSASQVAKPDMRGITWEQVTRWSQGSAHIAEVRALARCEARAALAVAEPVLRADEREACAKVADGETLVDGGEHIAATIRAELNAHKLHLDAAASALGLSPVSSEPVSVAAQKIVSELAAARELLARIATYAQEVDHDYYGLQSNEDFNAAETLNQIRAALKDGDAT